MQTCNQYKTASRKINDSADQLCMKLYLAQHPMQPVAVLLKQSSAQLQFYIPVINSEIVLKLKEIKGYIGIKGKEVKGEKQDEEFYLKPQTYLFNLNPDKTKKDSKDKKNNRKKEKENKGKETEETDQIKKEEEEEEIVEVVLQKYHEYTVVLTSTDDFPK